MKKLHTNKGFTLAELLIVVAIIAVLVAIAIPTFGNQTEKARESTDAANIRSAIADVTVKYLSADVVADAGYSDAVPLKQQTDGWTSAPAFLDSSGTAISATGTPKASGTCTVAITSAGVLSLTYSS